MSRLGTRLLIPLLALTCVLTAVTLESEAERTDVVPAADLSQWDAGNIISDKVFFDSGSMTADKIRSFLQLKGSGCQKTSTGPACIKDLVLTTKSRAADAYCNRYAGATESAAAIIKKVAVACGINPRVLIVMLQKEQGIITQQTPTAHEYSRAMGFGCPDNAGGSCDSAYYGLFNQIYNAAHQFKRYTANPRNYGFFPGYRTIGFYPAGPNPGDYNYRNQDCGATSVNIKNQATANLYNYTPYQPNKNVLKAGYRVADPPACAAYGNRNFYNWFTDWFGSTYVLNRDPDAPVGRLEAVQDRGDSVRVKGWVYDPNNPTSAMQVNVYAGGTKVGTDVTDQARADVATANYGAGPNQGFDAVLPVSAGEHTVCVYAVNIGAGATNPRLGCATLTVTTAASWNPKGKVADIRVAGTRLVVEGWSFDPDAPTWPSTVRVYAGSLRAGDVVADDEWAALGTAYPTAGDEHGFKLDTRLTAGTHRVCVYSFNKGTGTTNPKLGCETVTVTAPPVTAAITTGNPLGRLATAVQETTDGQDVEISGWSFDPDVPTAPATVRIFAGAKLLDTVVANRDWADVQKYFPYAGSAHGFTWRGILPHGSYNLCVQGVDQGAGTSTSVGCKAVDVVGDKASNPKGRLASADVTTPTKLTVKGWAYDPDTLKSPITVRLFDGSTKLADVLADEQWPALADYPSYAAAGTAHGFSWTGTLPAGTHKICAYALNVKYGTTNPLLGCLEAEVTGGASIEGTDTDAPPTMETPSEPATSSSETSAPEAAIVDGSQDAEVAEPAAVPASPTP